MFKTNIEGSFNNTLPLIELYVPFMAQPYKPFEKELKPFTKSDFEGMQKSIRRIYRFNGGSEMSVYRHSLFTAYLSEYFLGHTHGRPLYPDYNPPDLTFDYSKSIEIPKNIEDFYPGTHWLHQAEFLNKEKIRSLMQEYYPFNLVQREFIRLCLLVHDFGEAIIGDVVRPIKKELHYYDEGSNALDWFIINSMVYSPLYETCRGIIAKPTALALFIKHGLLNDEYNGNIDIVNYIGAVDSLASHMELECLKFRYKVLQREPKLNSVDIEWAEAWQRLVVSDEWLELGVPPEDSISKLSIVDYVEKAVQRLAILMCA